MRRSEFVGRVVGAAGAACASLFWGLMLFVVAALLMEPDNLAGLALIAAMPLAIFASLLFVVSAADLVVLVRRADVGMPWRVAATHVVMAVLILWLNRIDQRALLAASFLLAIAVTQVIALRLFARSQMTPSQVSSQR